MSSDASEMVSDETLIRMKAEDFQLEHLRSMPTMTSWFAPSLLSKLLLNVIVSDLFGQYADRRLIEAALDSEMAGTNYEDAVRPEADGSVWIDYVSDLGDGFDATYAIAYLLAQPSLQVGDLMLPRGQALILGGDEVYPTADRASYNLKFRKPYELAWPQTADEQFPRMFALPGNHDWYDGLSVFLAYFCRKKTTRIGNWGSIQRRSYFSVKLTNKWWLWGIDIALIRDMDQPQADYFAGALKRIPDYSNIILCSAEPGWYYAPEDGDSYRTLGYAASIAANAEKKNLRMPLVLSGDSHHYARYSGAGAEFITSGGGGAFLHGTIELESEIPIDWYKHYHAKLALKRAYPSREESISLLKGDLNFWRDNPGFSWTLAAIYFLFGSVVSKVPRPDVGIIAFAILWLGLAAYSKHQEPNLKAGRLLTTGLHALAHFVMIAGIAILCRWLFLTYLPWLDSYWLLWFLALGAVYAALGPALAGSIFGVSLYLTCRYGHRNFNDAFSAMRLDSHRHFLRMHIRDDTLTIYPVAVDKVPSRAEWRVNPSRTVAAPSVFEPASPLNPHLIETPIVIRAEEAPLAGEINAQPEAIPPSGE